MKHSLTKAAIFLIVCLLSNSVLAQQGEYIIGKLLDAKTQEPIAFASIRIKDRALGIISNTDGSFKIPLKYKEFGDIIEISSMGYQTKEILIHDLSIYELNNLRLQPATLELEEATVTAEKKRKKKLTAKQIVSRAIKAIPENYPVTPFSTVGYYRDYQLDSLQYVNLNEAIVEVFDEGFNEIDTVTTRTRIYDYVQNSQFERDTLSDQPYDYNRGNKIISNAFLSGYGGNEFTILRVHDAIRNYQLNSFDCINSLEDGDILKNHTFKRLEDTNLDDKPLYVIHLRRNRNGYIAKGKIYISKYDFAINKLEYALYYKNRVLKKFERTKNGVKGKLIFEATTAYKRNKGDMMYLNYISFNNTFQLRQPPKFVLKSKVLNIGRRNFVLTFNNTIDADNATEYANYEIFFKGKLIKFEKLVVLGNQVLLFPRIRTTKQINMWQFLQAAAENGNFNAIRFDIRNIRDVEGNLINEQFSKEYNQFREFFVQEIKFKPVVPFDSLIMNKYRPIFDNQPIVKPANFNDYWMNTPLQNIEN